MNIELHELHWIWNETVTRLDSFARDVREAKHVMEASNFARWLNFSGLVRVFNDNPSTQLHLEVDGALVQRKINDLLFECGELFRGGKADPKYAASDIAEINRKLDFLMEQLVTKQQSPTVVDDHCGSLSSRVPVPRWQSVALSVTDDR
jgi:hypothetical protein